jgi:hypothetical protein
VRIVLLLANSLLGWYENTKAGDAMQKLKDALTLGGAGGAAVLGGHALRLQAQDVREPKGHPHPGGAIIRPPPCIFP